MQAQRVTISLGAMFNAVEAMNGLMDEVLPPELAMMLMLNIDTLQQFVNAAMKVRDNIAKRFADEKGKISPANLTKANEQITTLFAMEKEVELFLVNYEDLRKVESSIVSPKTLANIRFMIYGTPILTNNVVIDFGEQDEGGEE